MDEAFFFPAHEDAGAREVGEVGAAEEEAGELVGWGGLVVGGGGEGVEGG